MNRLIAALEECATAHGFEFKHYEDERQVGIFGCNLPTVFDVRSIVSGFCGANSVAAIEASDSWGIITVYLDELELLPEDQIDWVSIKMALPYKEEDD